MAENMREVGGRWVPAVPLRAPLLYRWRCSHQWTPHIYEQGWTAWNFFDCTRCGASTEAAYQPDNHPWRVRSAIARFLLRG